MKKYLFLLPLFLLTQCGGEQKVTVEELIQKGSLTDLQNLKTSKQKTLNDLKLEIDKLDAAINVQNNNQKFLLGTDMLITPQEFKHYVAFQGTIDTDQNLVLYPELPGLLTDIYVQEGQRVKKGAVLARLSDGGMQDQLEQLRLQLALAKTTFERQQKLWDEKIGSEMQFLQAETTYKALKKSVSQMQDQVAKTKIIAPFDGIVDHIIADKGANMAPGATPIMRFINLNQMHLAGEIPEKHLPNIQKGADAKVFVPVLGKEMEATVSLVGNYINPNNRSFRIEIDLNNPEAMLKPNMTAQVLLNDYTNPEALLVPIKNILKNQNGDSYVFVLKNIEGEKNTYKAIKTFVKLGSESDNKREILSGLKAGDRILQEGVRLVKDQQSVKISNS